MKGGLRWFIPCLLAIGAFEACRPDPEPDDDDTNIADDGTLDDDDSASGCPDSDGDGYSAQLCGGPDCDDTNAEVHPGAEDVCGNGLDDDCDGRCPGCGLCGEVELATADAKILGATPSMSTGDLNGDGRDDAVLVGGGALAVFHSPPVGTIEASAAELIVTVDPADGPGVGVAEAVSGRFGKGPTDRQVVFGGRCGTQVHALMVDASAVGSVSAGSGLAVFRGEDSAGVGYCPVSVGDTDGDGLEELLLGLSETGESHRVVLHEAPLLGEVWPDTALATLVIDSLFYGEPRSLASGDFNGDGFDDVVVAEPSWHDPGPMDQQHEFQDDQDGLVAIVSGPISGEVNLANADARITGLRCRVWYSLSVEYVEFDRTFGRAIATGDLDGDGQDDLVIGSPEGCDQLHEWSVSDDGVNPAGEVSVFFGPIEGALSSRDAGLVITAEGAGTEGGPEFADIGVSVDLAGDVNGDGAVDLVVGADGWRVDEYEYGPGAVFVFYGPVTPGGVIHVDNADATLLGEGLFQFAHTASSLSSGGDLNGDGYADIVIGAPGDGEGGNLAGAAYIVYGGPGF